MLALHLFLTRSRLGKAMRAMADNADLAQVSGINTALVVRVTWIIAGALACMAGTMLALDVTLKPDLAFNIVLPIFAAAIVGGLGQAYGAIAGGFLIGFAETLAVFNWTVLLRPFQADAARWSQLPADLALVPTEYKLTVAFVILVVVLLCAADRHLQGSLVMIAALALIAVRRRCSSLIVVVGLVHGRGHSPRCSWSQSLRLCADRAGAQHPVGLWRAVQLRHHGLPDAGRLCRHLHLLSRSTRRSGARTAR